MYEDRQYKDDMKLMDVLVEAFFITRRFNLLRWLKFKYFLFLLFHYPDPFEFMRTNSTNSFCLSNKITRFFWIKLIYHLL